MIVLSCGKARRVRKGTLVLSKEKEKINNENKNLIIIYCSHVDMGQLRFTPLQ